MSETSEVPEPDLDLDPDVFPIHSDMYNLVTWQVR